MVVDRRVEILTRREIVSSIQLILRGITFQIYNVECEINRYGFSSVEKALRYIVQHGERVVSWTKSSLSHSFSECTSVSITTCIWMGACIVYVVKRHILCNPIFLS